MSSSKLIEIEPIKRSFQNFKWNGEMIEHLSYFDDLEKRLGIKDLDFIEEGEFKV
jgi:hypothetical protein